MNTEIKEAILELYKDAPRFPAGLVLICAFHKIFKPVLGHSRGLTAAEFMFRFCCLDKREHNLDADEVITEAANVAKLIIDGWYFPSRDDIADQTRRLTAL